MSKVVPFPGKPVTPEALLRKKIAKSSMDLLLSEADSIAETSDKVEPTPSFQIIRIMGSNLLITSLPIGRIGMLNAYDKTRILIIKKSKSGRVYKASFGKRKTLRTQYCGFLIVVYNVLRSRKLFYSQSKSDLIKLIAIILNHLTCHSPDNLLYAFVMFFIDCTTKMLVQCRQPPFQ